MEMLPGGPLYARHGGYGFILVADMGLRVSGGHDMGLRVSGGSSLWSHLRGF